MADPAAANANLVDPAPPDSVPMSFHRSFSWKLVGAKDGERFFIASIGLIVALALLVVCTLIATIEAHPLDMDTVLPMARQNSTWLCLLGISFVMSCFLPVILYSKGRLHYLTGTICNCFGFVTLTISLALLVCATGGVGSSIFGATFLSMLGTSLIVPKEKALRLILFCFVIVVSIVIVWLVHTDDRKFRHDAAVFTLALAINFFSWIFKVLLDAFTLMRVAGASPEQQKGG